MKKVLFILLISSTSFAKDKNDFKDNPNTINFLSQYLPENPKACLNIVALRSVIVAKIDQTTYELAPNGILWTHEGGFKGNGAPNGMMVKYLGSKPVLMKNGFSELYQFWEECKCKKGEKTCK